MAKDKFTDDDIDYDGLDLDSFDDDFDSVGDAIDVSPDKKPGKRKPYTDFSVGVGESFKPSAANFAKVTHHISKAFPKTGSLLDSSISNISEAKRMAQEISRNVAPSLNRLKLVSGRFLPKVEKLIPKKLYGKLDEKLNKPGYSDDRPSEEEMRDNSIRDQLATIFNQQQSDQRQKYTEDLTRSEIDRQVKISEHTESTTIFSQIRNLLKSNQVFNNTTFKGYMMKSLELQFQSFFVAKDMFDISKGTMGILESKLEEIKVNTGLPEIQKKLKTESYEEYKRARTYGALGEKVGDYMTGFGKKAMGKTKDFLSNKLESAINNSLDMVSDVGENVLDNEEMKKDMGEAPTTATNVAGQIFGSILSSLAIKGGIAGLKNASGGRHIKLDDMVDHMKHKTIVGLNDKIKNSDNWFWNLAKEFAPTLDEERGNIENVLAKNATDDISFDVLTRKSIVEIIPGFLSKILQQSTYANSLFKSANPNLPDSPLPNEVVYDKDREDFTTASVLKAKIEDTLFGSKEKRTEDIGDLVNRLYSGYSLHKDSSKADFEASLPDIVKFLNNLAKHVKVVHPDSILKFLKGEEISTEEEIYLEWVFKDIPDDNKPKIAEILSKSFFKDIDSDKLETRETLLSDLDMKAFNISKDRDSMVTDIGELNVFGTKRFMTGLMEDRSIEDVQKYKERITKETLQEVKKKSKGKISSLSKKDISDIDAKVMRYSKEYGVSHKYIRDKNADVDYDTIAQSLESDKTKKYKEELENDFKPITAKEAWENSKNGLKKAMTNIKKWATFKEDEEEQPTTPTVPSTDATQEEPIPTPTQEDKREKRNAVRRKRYAESKLVNKEFKEPLSESEIIQEEPIPTSTQEDKREKRNAVRRKRYAESKLVNKEFKEPLSESKTEKARKTVEKKTGKKTKSHDKLNISGPGIYVQGVERELHMPLEKAKIFWQDAAASFKEALDKSETLIYIKEVAAEGKEIAKESFEAAKKWAIEEFTYRKDQVKREIEYRKVMIKSALDNSEAYQKGKKFASENYDKGKQFASENYDKGKQFASENYDKGKKKGKEYYDKGKKKGKEYYDKFKETDKKEYAKGFVNRRKEAFFDFLDKITPNKAFKKASSMFSPKEDSEKESIFSPLKRKKGFNDILLGHIKDIKKILKSSHASISQSNPEILGALLNLLSLNGIKVGGRFKNYIKNTYNAAKTVSTDAYKGLKSITGSLFGVSKDLVKGAVDTGIKVGSGLFGSKDGKDSLAMRGIKGVGKVGKGVFDFQMGLLERIIGIPLNFIKSPKGILSKLSNITRIGLFKQDKYVDVYLKDNVKPGSPLITAQQQIEGKVIFADGTLIKNSRDIKQPVINKRSKNVKISTEHIEKGLVDVNNKPLVKKLSLLQLGKKLVKGSLALTKAQIKNTIGVTALGVGTVASGAKTLWDKLRRNPTDPNAPKESMLEKFKRYRNLDFKMPDKFKMPKIPGMEGFKGFNMPGLAGVKGLFESKQSKQLEKITDILTSIAVGLGIDVNSLFKSKFTSKLKNPFTKEHLAKEKRRDGFFSSFGKKVKDTASKLNPFRKGNEEAGTKDGIGRQLLSSAGGAIAGTAAFQGLKAGAGIAARAIGGAAIGGLGMAGNAAMGAGSFLLTNPVGWAILGTAAVVGGSIYAYGKYKDSKRKAAYRKRRLPLYGAKEDIIDEIADLEEKVNKLEKGQMLSVEDITEFAEDFGFDVKNKKHLEFFTLWFSKRFSVVFDTYRHALKTMNFSFNDEESVPEKEIESIMKRTKTWSAPSLVGLEFLIPYPKAVDGMTKETKNKKGAAMDSKIKDAVATTSAATQSTNKSNVIDIKTGKPMSSGPSVGPTVAAAGAAAGASAMDFDLSSDGPLPTIDFDKMKDLGALSAQYESGNLGDNAIGYDGKGGTSYGKYQIASKTGTFDQFIDWMFAQGPTGIKIAEDLKAAGAANTGSKTGAVPEVWKKYANEGLIGPYSHKFIKETHYDIAYNKLNGNIKSLVDKSKTLQNVLWSTAVQHGPYGASKLLNKIFKEGMSIDEFIKAIYRERSGKFNGSDAGTRKSVMNRFKDEQSKALAMVASESVTVPIGEALGKKEDDEEDKETSKKGAPPKKPIGSDIAKASVIPISVALSKKNDQKQKANDSIRQAAKANATEDSTDSVVASSIVAKSSSVSNVIPISKVAVETEDHRKPAEVVKIDQSNSYMEKQIALLESINNHLNGINNNVSKIDTSTSKDGIINAVDALSNKIIDLFKEVSKPNTNGEVGKSKSNSYRNVDDNYKPQQNISTSKKRVAI